ncbi:MAG: hypothetical protein Q9217_006883, partial [Psora testacea]
NASIGPRNLTQSSNTDEETQFPSHPQDRVSFENASLSSSPQPIPTPSSPTLSERSPSPYLLLSTDQEVEEPPIKRSEEGDEKEEGVGNEVEDPEREEESEEESEDVFSTMPPSKNAKPVYEQLGDLKKHFHFYNNPDARQRGHEIIEAAIHILQGVRGSPTAKNNVNAIQRTAYDAPWKGEDTFVLELLKIIINDSRLVPKPGVPKDRRLTIEDFDLNPRPWKEDYIGYKLKGVIPQAKVPQLKAPAGSQQAVLSAYPALSGATPDLAFGFDSRLLPLNMQQIFDAIDCSVTKELFHVFLIVEFKTEEQPLAQAEVQTMHGGSAAVDACYQWILKVDGKNTPPGPTAAALLSSTHGTSMPDHHSWIFSLACSPENTNMQVHWREIWSDNVVFWHTSLLDTYNFRYGQDEPTERFQRHFNNVLDWGVGVRKEMIFDQAAKLIARVAPPVHLPNPKKQKVTDTR